MSYLLFMFAVLTIGAFALMAGSYFLNDGLGLSPHRMIRDSLVWGVSFLVSFAAEFVSLTRVL